jgi:tRNA A37 methylthiotransferase MiaB
MAHSSLFMKQVSEEIRKIRPDIIQITGGAWVNSVEEFVLRNVDLDYVVTGEAEVIIVDLVEALLRGEKDLEFPGLSYLKDDQFISIKPGRTTGRGFMFVPRKTLHKLPFPAYHLFNMDFYSQRTTPKDYFWFTNILPELEKTGEHEKEIKVGSILSGRGCFGKCDFCGAASTARRNSTPAYVVDNMEYLSQKYGMNTFQFMESLTFAAPKWVTIFCQELIDRNLNFYWIAISRGDFKYTEEMLALLKKSGCIAINIGFESGSNKMLENMRKEVTVEQYEDIYSDFSRHNILVFGQFITNMPGETIGTLTETANFVRRTKMLFSFGAAHPYADSKLFDWAKERKFCDVEDVMFTKEHKGKFSRDEVKDYIDRWNFNQLEFNDFYRQWKFLNKIKLHNSLFHSRKYIQLFLLRLSPSFLYSAVVRVHIFTKRLKDFAFRLGALTKKQGLISGGRYFMTRLLSNCNLQPPGHGDDLASVRLLQRK